MAGIAGAVSMSGAGGGGRWLDGESRRLVVVWVRKFDEWHRVEGGGGRLWLNR